VVEKVSKLLIYTKTDVQFEIRVINPIG